MPRGRPYYYGKSRGTRSCFRNPCCICLSVFFVLATLRLRVRPKRAAQWIHKQSTHLRSNIPETSKSKIARQQKFDTMEFKLSEDGILPGAKGRAFQRYQAMWHQRGQVLPSDEQKPVSIEEWVRTMLSSNEVMTDFVKVLQQSPYSAFYFETRPVTAAQLNTKAFEFVLVDAPELHEFATTRPDATAFADHFTSCKDGMACTFTNLGKDATLIAPKPPTISDTNSLHAGHLAEFCRHTDNVVVMATWRLAMQTYLEQVKEQAPRTLWFSTSGMGIAWLHFRVDQRPKYYTYKKFRDETG